MQLKYILFIPAILLIIFLYTYKLFYTFNFHPDFARDIYDLLMIVRGKPSLIGPKLSFGGIYSGPYYYYLLLPVFYLSNLNIYSLPILNAVFFVLALAFFYLFISKKYGVFSAILSTLAFAFIPIYLTHSRSPWNGSFYLPLLLIFLIWLYFGKFGRIESFLMGFLAGVITSIHLVNFPLLIFSAVFLFYFLKKRKNLGFYFYGILTAFLPLIIFEFRHNFVMLKNTFITGSYLNFIENKNIPDAVSGNKNVFKNILFLGKNLSLQLGVNILFYFGFFAFVWNRIKFEKNKFLIKSVSLLVPLYALLLRYQFGQHYLFPLSLVIAFTAIITILNLKSKWLLLVIILLELYSFPKNIYGLGARKPEKYETAVRYAINKKIIKENEPFNIIQYSEEYRIYVPVGHEYRFFFLKHGFKPKSEFEYNSSDILLIFSEAEELDILKLNSWELDQFGKENLRISEKYQIGDITIFKIKKTYD